MDGLTHTKQLLNLLCIVYLPFECIIYDSNQTRFSKVQHKGIIFAMFIPMLFEEHLGYHYPLPLSFHFYGRDLGATDSCIFADLGPVCDIKRTRATI